MGTEFVELLLQLSVNVIEKRGEKPIQKNEIAVCVACRPTYLAEHCPDTEVVYVPRETEDGEPDGFEAEARHQNEIPF